MNWFDKWLRKRNTRKFIRHFIENISKSVIIKEWEHYGWGDAIHFNGTQMYGHLSGLRYSGGFCINVCDLRNGDILITDVSHCKNPIRNGHRYEIGIFVNVQICADPPDMFFASYIRLGYADCWSKESIIRLANERIASL